MSLVKRQPVHGLIQWCNGSIVKCFFHAGKSMLDQQEILDMASPKLSGMSIAVHRPVQHTP
jgi:hypothetical protein